MRETLNSIEKEFFPFSYLTILNSQLPHLFLVRFYEVMEIKKKEKESNRKESFWCSKVPFRCGKIIKIYEKWSDNVRMCTSSFSFIAMTYFNGFSCVRWSMKSETITFYGILYGICLLFHLFLFQSSFLDLAVLFYFSKKGLP